jgi:hypothetical protein
MELAIKFGKYIMSLTNEQREYSTVEQLYKIFMTYERTKKIPR